MYAKKEDLQRLSARQMTADDLRAAGVIPKVKAGEARSLVQRMKIKKAEEQQKQRRQGKRERRREAARAMAEARARGEC